MCSISNQDKQVIIKSLEKIDSELKEESKRFGNAKESVTVGHRKPVVEGVLEHLKSSSTFGLRNFDKAMRDSLKKY
ncbi:MAG: hypothetical protein LBH78_03245 [Rickettsiales bacterium]|jgi:hypothetical protein|nr:hypothetical protein [Rickettsiales bacterium]